MNEVFARGRARHRDHATSVLHDWRRVLPNTERGPWRQQLVVLD